MPVPSLQLYSSSSNHPWEASPLDIRNRLRVLRLSVTDLCNLRCRYCMPASGVLKTAHRSLLPLEDLAGLVAWLTTHTGIESLRLTGGEPLVRPGIQHLIAKLSTLPRVREVTLTTNGTLLSRTAWSLKAAGLSRVNVSLDSVDQQRFAEVTRGGDLSRTLAGIRAAQDAGLIPVKINSVLRRSTWKQEVPRLLDYAATNGLEIRFIELMRTGTERAWCESEFVSVEDVWRGLGMELVTTKERGQSPARRTVVNWRGSGLTVGWITPRSRPFCSQCERLRMDARGQIRRCLMDPITLDLAGLVKTADLETAIGNFKSYLAAKASPPAMDSSFAMSEIGG